MRRLAWFSGGFAAVCGAVCSLSPSLCLPLGVGFALLGLLALGLWLSSRRDPRHPPLWQISRRAMALALGGVCAAGWFWGWCALFKAPADALAGKDRTLTGTVLSSPEPTSVGGYSMVLALEEEGAISPRALVYAPPHWGDLRPGDRVTFTGELTSSLTLLGEDNSYYAAKNIFLLGYVHHPPQSVSRPHRLPLRLWPLFCASALKESISAAFGELAPLAAAVTLGDKSGLDEGVLSALSRSGTAHTVAVSGMHLSFLVGVCLLLAGKNRSRVVFLLPVLLFYALVTGASPSALRAVVMQSVILLAPLFFREPDSPTGLSLALLILLLSNPWSAASVSLQLSFASVSGILLLAAPLNRRLLRLPEKLWAGRREPGYRLALSLARMTAASLSTGVGATFFAQPLLCLYFGRLSLVFPLTNLLILWAVSLFFALALSVALLGVFFPAAAAFLAPAAGLPARYILWVVTAVGRWPFAAVDTENPYYLICLAAVYLFVGAALLRRRDRLRLPIPLACLGVLILTAFLFSRRPVYSHLTVTALDVGQGSSTAMVSAGSTCLVDCGGSDGNAGDIAADYFSSMGIKKLDLLVLTHFDGDHFNGVAQLFRRMEVDRVAIPDVEAAYGRMEELLSLCEGEGTIVTYVTEEETVPLGASVLTLFPPLGSGTSNEEGLFALCSAGDFDVLITGDADYYVEKMLVRYYNIPDIELLIAGHHGAATSTSEELLDAADPEIAIISVGRNAYGHPAQSTLNRLEERDIRVYRTDGNGSVSIQVRSDGYAAQTQNR